MLRNYYGKVYEAKYSFDDSRMSFYDLQNQIDYPDDFINVDYVHKGYELLPYNKYDIKTIDEERVSIDNIISLVESKKRVPGGYNYYTNYTYVVQADGVKYAKLQEEIINNAINKKNRIKDNIISFERKEAWISG